MPGPAQPPSRWWKADLSVREPGIHYRFVLEADDGVWFYSAAGPAAHDPLDRQRLPLLADAAPPAWLRSACSTRSSPTASPTAIPRAILARTSTLTGDIGLARSPGKRFRRRTRRSAGVLRRDLRGIRERLDHLTNLGVSALYLNPVFTSFSNHKYDVADYEHVDAHLGGDEELARLRQALADRGMRYLLDVVPNHVGSSHPWFQAAQADASALEAGFFTFARHPDQYAPGWASSPSPSWIIGARSFAAAW